jgi:hypothetical protein
MIGACPLLPHVLLEPAPRRLRREPDHGGISQPWKPVALGQSVAFVWLLLSPIASMAHMPDPVDGVDPETVISAVVEAPTS